MDQSETRPQDSAKVLNLTPGKGGVIPPVEHRFGPGNNANPGGRPKGASTLAPLLRKLAAKPNEHGEGERAEALAEKMLRDYERGEYDGVTAGLKIMERTDGLMTQKIETEKRKRIVLDLGDAPAKPKESA